YERQHHRHPERAQRVEGSWLLMLARMRSLDSLRSLEMTREADSLGVTRQVRVTRAVDSLGMIGMTREVGMAGIDIGSFLLSWLCCDA
ncbi:hypothetical protein, partial [Bifidobacterium aquikefiri]